MLVNDKMLKEEYYELNWYGIKIEEDTKSFINRLWKIKNDIKEEKGE